MTRLFKLSMAALALAALTMPGPAASQDAAQAPDTVKSTHGDWDVVCDIAQPDQCTIRQIGTAADGQKVLVVHIRKLDGAATPDGKPLPGAIQITTPLGTILRAGVMVKIDDGEPRTGVFELCVPSGCIIRDPMSEEFLASLKAGDVARMTFNVIQRGTMNVNISLKGFTKAFGKL